VQLERLKETRTCVLLPASPSLFEWFFYLETHRLYTKHVTRNTREFGGGETVAVQDSNACTAARKTKG
jgi:hypothetical protein